MQVPMRYRTFVARVEGRLWESLIAAASEDWERVLAVSILDVPSNNETIK
jgi:hypothetical protein